MADKERVEPDQDAEWSLLMKWHWSVLVLTLLASPGLAEETLPVSPGPTAGVWPSADLAPASEGIFTTGPDSSQGGRLTSNRDFPNFIGFLSNPLQNIDPRSLTQIWP